MSEFDLIQRYFTRPTPGAELGVGDDAALLRVKPGMELAVSTDMLVSGTHFFPDTDPFLLGHKTLAVNLSDLAAMGAAPRWATLSLSLPQVNEIWLQRFSQGFFALADRYGVDLVGGDTTRGPLNLCVSIMGEVPQGQSLRRDGAQAGDDIWVSGQIGNAAMGLALLQGKIELSADLQQACLDALQQPQPRVELGAALRGIAHSAIDISDGLLADLGHILERSQLGAEVHCADLPVAAELRTRSAWHYALSGGDDYELCFTAAPAMRATIEKLSAILGLSLSRIGTILPALGCSVYAPDGSLMKTGKGGYDHFA